MEKIIKVWLWKQTILLLWDSNPEEYKKLVRSQWEEDNAIQEYEIWRTNLLDNGCVIIYVKKIKDRKRMVLTLNHEILHAVKFTLDDRWISFDDEVYAYTIEHIQNKCYKEIWIEF